MSQWGGFSFTLSRTMRLQGITCEKLADMANVQKNQLNMYINNEVKRPDLSVLARICAVLNCGVEEILHYNPPDKNVMPCLRANNKTRFTTGQIAKILSVHPNTIRWYEKTGLISPAERSSNQYRHFNGRHLVQLRVCRIIFGSTYSNRTIRSSAFVILAALKEWNIEYSLSQAKKYKQLLEKEYASALETAAMLKAWTEHKALPSSVKTYTRKDMADLLGITTEALRNWERNGLANVNRSGLKNERVYSDADLVRFRVIYMLRANNYSIAAIQHSLSLYDEGNGVGAALALNQPALDPDSIYLNAGDHWLEVLTELSRSADRILEIVQGIATQHYNETPLLPSGRPYEPNELLTPYTPCTSAPRPARPPCFPAARHG